MKRLSNKILLESIIKEIHISRDEIKHAQSVNDDMTRNISINVANLTEDSELTRLKLDSIVENLEVVRKKISSVMNNARNQCFLHGICLFISIYILLLLL
tara:strand:- start:669 stop:968 length:300 start_codon:yes stop_codon:yes gene_type:complete